MAYSNAQVLARVIDESVPDLRLKNAVLLDYLNSKGRVQSAPATKLEWNAIVNGSTAARGSMSTAGTDQNTGDAVTASLVIGTDKVYHQFTETRVKLVEAKRQGVGALKDLLSQNIYGGVQAIRREVNELLWTGTGNAASAGVVGLAPVLNDTAAYAGIDPATYPNWAPVVLKAGAPRPLTKNLLYDFTNTIEKKETYHDVLMCHSDLGQTYTGLFDGIAGINSVRNVDSGKKDVGVGSRYYNDVPIITDPQAPLGQMVGLRDTDLTLFSLDLADATDPTASQYGFNPNFTSIASADVGGLRVNVAMLPSANPANVIVQMFVCLQLRVFNRKGVQAILNLQ